MGRRAAARKAFQSTRKSARRDAPCTVTCTHHTRPTSAPLCHTSRLLGGIVAVPRSEATAGQLLGAAGSGSAPSSPYGACRRAGSAQATSHRLRTGHESSATQATSHRRHRAGSAQATSHWLRTGHESSATQCRLRTGHESSARRRGFIHGPEERRASLP